MRKKRTVFLTLVLALVLCACLGGTALADWEQQADGIAWKAESESDGVLLEAELMGLPQLSTPTDLEWGKSYGPMGDYEGAIPGFASYKLGEVSQNHYLVEYYRVNSEGEDFFVHKASWGFSEDEIEPGHSMSAFSLLEVDDLPSGDYYFTVTALGDGTTYADSEPAKSPVWHYENPGVRLDPPEGPVWSVVPDESGYRYITFDLAGSPLVYAWQAEFLYAASLDEEPVEVGGGTSGWGRMSLNPFAMRNGAGYYYARIRLLSKDITQFGSSDWSELSDPVYISGEDDELETIVSSVDETSTKDEIQQAVEDVRALDTAELTEAMLADRYNNGAAGQVAQLEALAGTTASVALSNAMQGTFDASQVSVIGAGLNVEVGESVTLQVGQADQGTTVPAMYQNAVQFSMHLEDTNGNNLTPNGASLAVPVKISMPVPAGINPLFLVMIHHHADGSYEEIMDYYIHQKSGTWYADFVVRSFSDFIFAEKRAIAGRTDSGVVVNVASIEDADKVICAVYDENGKMLRAAFAEANAGTEVPLSDPEEAAKVRVFFLSEGFSPVAPSSVIPLGSA